MNARELHRAANLHMQNGDITRALEIYTRLCTLNPRDIRAWHMCSAINGMLGDYSSAAYCCEKVIHLKPDVAGIYANYGNALMKLQRFDDALVAFRKAVELDKADSRCLNNMGTLYRKLGRNNKAEASYRRAIEVAPGFIEAYCNLAILLKDAGRYAECALTCEMILSRDKDNSIAHSLILECLLDREAFTNALRCLDITSIPRSKSTDHLLVIVRNLYAQGKFTEAVQVIEKALPALPDDKRFRVVLARCKIRNGSENAVTALLHELEETELSYQDLMLISESCLSVNDYDRAGAFLERAHERHPEEVLPRVKLSRITFNRGEREKAICELEQILEQHPESEEALTELGYIYYLVGDYKRAIEYDKRAIFAHPQNAPTHNNLGTVYLQCGQELAAEACFQEAIRLDPGLLSAKCNLAYTYSVLRKYGKSVSHYDKVLESHPTHAGALTGKAVVLERMGEAETAYGLVAPLVDAGCRDALTLLAYARASPKVNKETVAIKLLEDVLDDPSVSLHNKIQMYFLLGKLHDRKGEYDRAFSCYQTGNDLIPARFSRGAHRQSVDAIMSAFSPEKMANYPRSSNASDKPVFIVGMPRSGTSLVEQILSAHPDIHGAGELMHIRNIASLIKRITHSDQGFPANLDRLTTGILNHLADVYLQNVEREAQDALRITDKMPSNFRLLGLIELLFPKARVIHCIRDPRDSCLSCYFQQFLKGQYFSSSLSDTAFYYNTYQELMRHWKSALSLPVLEVNYEEMVASQEEVSRKLLGFIGLDWHPDCLNFHKTGRQVFTASYDQVRQPLYTSAVGRWKNYRAHLGELLNGLDLDNGHREVPGSEKM